MKSRDDIVKSASDLHTTPFSKMATIPPSKSSISGTIPPGQIFLVSNHMLFFGKQEDKPEKSSVEFIDNIIVIVDNDKHLGKVIGQIIINCKYKKR